MKLLLTGFEPFDRQPINVSQRVVETLAETGIEGVTLETAVLPVDRFEGPDKLIRTVIKTQPAAVICLGQADGRSAISIERVAINLLDFSIADNGGNLERNKQIQREAHDAYFASLPVLAMVQAVRAGGVPAEQSLSAGTFLCNQVMFELLYYLNRHQLPIRAGFIHLPLLPEQAASRERPLPSLPLDILCRGITLAVQPLLKPPA